MNLGENIYRLRTAKNMSQGDLADALDVSRQSVSKWENNSAVPELEKLIKMSQLFGVTLDELAGLEQSPKPSDREPKIIYIEKTSMQGISKHTLIGATILLCSLIYMLLLNGGVFGTTEAILLAAPFALCGLSFLFLQYPQFYCGWACTAAYWLHLFILMHHNWEDQHFLLLLGVVLVIAMILWSSRVHRAGKVSIPTWIWVLGGIVLTGAFVLLWINVVPPLEASSTHTATESAPPWLQG